jgi:hypothetical protein
MPLRATRSRRATCLGLKSSRHAHSVTRPCLDSTARCRKSLSLLPIFDDPNGAPPTPTGGSTPQDGDR